MYPFLTSYHPSPTRTCAPIISAVNEQGNRTTMTARFLGFHAAHRLPAWNKTKKRCYTTPCRQTESVRNISCQRRKNSTTKNMTTFIMYGCAQGGNRQSGGPLTSFSASLGPAESLSTGRLAVFCAFVVRPCICTLILKATAVSLAASEGAEPISQASAALPAAA